MSVSLAKPKPSVSDAPTLSRAVAEYARSEAVRDARLVAFREALSEENGARIEARRRIEEAKAELARAEERLGETLSLSGSEARTAPALARLSRDAEAVIEAVEALEETRDIAETYVSDALEESAGARERFRSARADFYEAVSAIGVFYL